MSQRLREETAGGHNVNCVECSWRIKLDEEKKDTIGFGDMEVFSDFGKRFGWGGEARQKG